MPKNPHADFTPTLAGYSGITPFRFWCQTALPLTYDDSLSYYELLNKVVNYLNHTIEDLTNVENNTSELAEAYEQLQKYVNDYFDDIDIEAELRNVLDKMAEDGTLDALLDPLVENQLPGVVDEKIDGVVAGQIDEAVAGQIDESVADQLPTIVEENVPGVVSGWLTENVNPVGSAVVVDSSLTISGAAADAKVTGDEVSNLKTQLKDLDTVVHVDEGVLQYTDNGNLYDSTNPKMLLEDKYVNNSGDIIDNATYNVIIVPIFDTTGLYTLMTSNSDGTVWINNTGACGCFDINGNKLGIATLVTNGINVPYNRTRYLAFNCSDTYLAKQPMIIHNWDGVNKPSYVDYALPTASVIGLQGAIDSETLVSEVNSKVKNQNGYFYETVKYNLMNDDDTDAGEGTIKPADGTVNPVSGYYHSGYIDIHDHDGYITAYTGNTNFTTPSYAFQRLAFYDQNKAFIANSGIDNNSNISDLTTATIAVPSGAYYVRIGFNGTKSGSSRMVNYGKWYGQYYPYIKEITYIKNDVFGWYKKCWSAYGDSITAIVNGNSPCQGWARYINEKFGITDFYGRGIGSQSFNYNEHGGAVCFINADGTYNSRNNDYNLDNYTGSVPSGCTAVRGAYCAWSRITAMYPAEIKDNIDMVFIMGGTNDSSDTAEVTWVANSTVDPEWAESDYYSDYGGDYNINTLKGGVASTIMKFQAWMPNAVIVIGTPLNGQTNRAGEIRPDYTPDEYAKTVKIMDVSRLFGIPCVDVFGTCGINMVNSPTYITDGTHPYNTAGHKMLARAIIGGLKTIEPNL